MLLLAACSSSGKTTVTAEKAVAIPNTATAVLSVKADLAKAHRYEDRAVETLGQQLASGLVKGGVFRSVSLASSAPPVGDYRIDVKITRMRVITPGGRVMFGFMAGRNYVQVDVSVRNAASGDLVMSFETTGSGASIGWGAQSYGVDDPVREVAKRVIKKLK